MSHRQLSSGEASLEVNQMNKLFNHPLISMLSASGTPELYDGEHQADVRCPVVEMGRVWRPSIEGDMESTRDIPATVLIQSYRNSGVLIVSLAFRDSDAHHIGRPLRRFNKNPLPSYFGDSGSVEQGFKTIQGVVNSPEGRGRIIYEKPNGKRGIWNELTNADITAFVAVGLYAYTKHVNYRRQQVDYADTDLYP